ncbi:MAG: 4-hydroxythreonine-4-phosphate dehydrogenase PdxA [Proteobacteria bacterium]|nr:4-hydroxythreonine-4-phosphate dehydrogenase PdxA [Pseudomonadota bacterium]
MKPIIGITMGDPAGVGPEIIVKALNESNKIGDYLPVVISDASVLREAIKRFNLTLKIHAFYDLNEVVDDTKLINVLDFDQLNRDNFVYGKLDKNCGAISFAGVKLAVKLCLQKQLAAMVTAPISKEAWHLAGHHFDGHTGFIAQATGTQKYRMMLASEKLKTLHTTAHVPLVDACRSLTELKVLDSIVLGYQHMQRLGYPTPRIAVCGLNPHAGENGIFGDEDIKIIKPAVETARKKGIPVFGPLPADTTFMKAYQGAYDLVVAQYHDQGHVPGKLVAFDTGVNVTVGLPIIRTSVDHGTAFDIAWQGTAKHGNLHCALNYALKMVRNRK